jgi:uncharacterized alpha-E superfamily protein
MSCSGYEPFHKKSRATPIDPGIAVAEFLIFEEEFPRSVRHCLTECRRSIEAIGRPTGYVATEADRKFDDLLRWLDSRKIMDLIGSGLHESLTYVVDSIHAIGHAVQETYFMGQAPVAKSQTQSQSQGQSQSQSQGQKQKQG